MNEMNLSSTNMTSTDTHNTDMTVVHSEASKSFDKLNHIKRVEQKFIFKFPEIRQHTSGTVGACIDEDTCIMKRMQIECGTDTCGTQITCRNRNLRHLTNENLKNFDKSRIEDKFIFQIQQHR